jgi:flagellar export protein FliJ
LQEARIVWANLAEGAALGQRWTAGSRAQHWATLQAQEEHCRRLAKELDARSHEVAKERQTATAAYQNYEIVRRLEDKWRREEQRCEARRSQKMMDEFAGAIVRRRAEGDYL